MARRQRAERLRLLRFTAEKKARVGRIVARDRGLAALLDGRDYRIERVIAWAARERYEVVGGVANLRLARPIENAVASLPLRCLAREGNREIDVDYRVRIEHADRLHAFAELDSGRVRTIRVLPPGRTVPLGGGSAGRCRPTRD